MIRAIIVDDELKGRNLLNELIANRFPDIAIVALAKNADEGIQSIEKFNPDLVFLDINMPGKSGFDMLAAIQNINFEIIFITAYDKYAIRAFRYHAFDYLLKPLDVEELSDCIARLKEKKLHSDLGKRLGSLITQIQQPQLLPDRITINSLDGITFILINEIIYLEAAGTYTLFYLKNKDKIVSSLNLKEYEELLTDYHFFRVHNSFLINLAEVKKIIKTEGGSVMMSNETQVPVSKRRRDEFLLSLGIKKPSV
ncbi:MAG: response regulator transcription factor [Bacteroidetes bacterium]|nr:response regulator transcription factor [Bacteroidota bacterium]